jgi:hypothetical protein
LDKELETYYEECFNTFATQGWKYLVEDFTKLKDNVKDLSTVADAQQLFYRQGQLDILNLFLDRKVVTERAWQDLQASEEADSA